MSNQLTYKDFSTKIRFSAKDNMLYGKIEGITDSVSFHGQSVDEVKSAFHEAVDDYIDFCKRSEKEELYKTGLEVFDDDIEDFRAWLNSEIPSFDGKKPIDLIESPEGLESVMKVLGRIEYGIF